MEIVVSTNFKRQARKAVLAIIFFFISFFLLICIGLSIAALLAYLGFLIVSVVRNFVVLIIALGLVASSVILIIFLFKFIFKKHVSNTTGMKQIYASEHPQLFKLIYDLAQNVGTDIPKKVFITDQLNASVFYDSTFWSMLFPVRKNLMIGYALINISTEQELKGIIAHEFGHFSQKSMKVGSYVYNCNRIIYNLVYENSSFEETVNKFSNNHILLKLTVGLSIYIIRGFQFVLKVLYSVLNKNYLSLSREMEFHADAVATHIVGSQVMIESLSRLDISDRAYETMMAFVNLKYQEGFKFENLSRIQLNVLTFLCQEKRMTFKNQLPIVSLEDLNLNNKSRLNVKDQWASHPSTEERILSIKKLDIPQFSISDCQAKQLFNHSENLELNFTQNFYPQDKFESLKTINPQQEKELFDIYYQSKTFNKEYNGYFNYKNPLVEKPNVISPVDEISFNRLFSDSVIDKVNEFRTLEIDFNDMTFLAIEKHKIKTFDFDGIKYNKKQASKLLETLNKEKEELQKDIYTHDVLVYNYFYQQAQKRAVFDEWNAIYDDYILMDRFYDKGFEEVNKLEKMISFMHQNLHINDIRIKLRDLKDFEKVFKEHLKELQSLKSYDNEIEESHKKSISDYLNNNEGYLLNDNWNRTSLDLLFTFLQIISYVHSDLVFAAKKALLDYQVKYLK